MTLQPPARCVDAHVHFPFDKKGTIQACRRCLLFNSFNCHDSNYFDPRFVPCVFVCVYEVVWECALHSHLNRIFGQTSRRRYRCDVDLEHLFPHLSWSKSGERLQFNSLYPFLIKSKSKINHFAHRSNPEKYFPIDSLTPTRHRKLGRCAIKTTFVPMPTNSSPEEEEGGGKGVREGEEWKINSILRFDRYLHSHPSHFILLSYSRHCLQYFYFRFYSKTFRSQIDWPIERCLRWCCCCCYCRCVCYFYPFLLVREKNLSRAP